MAYFSYQFSFTISDYLLYLSCSWPTKPAQHDDNEVKLPAELLQLLNLPVVAQLGGEGASSGLSYE